MVARLFHLWPDYRTAPSSIADRNVIRKNNLEQRKVIYASV
jgi:hypothetical protein